MKILTVIGARPQFIKASVVSKAIREAAGISEVILHTGQHFDTNMSDIFFNQLSIPRPDIQLNINGDGHGAMTGRMLIEIEKALVEQQPDRVLVYGDTNSTLAAALAAVKLHIPVAHVEAGLRSFNMQMPEEVNRIVTDQVSDLLFCPTDAAMKNLVNEGFENRPGECLQVGDVMQDSAFLFAQQATLPEEIDADGGYVLATLHRAENTDVLARLSSIIDAINRIHVTLAPVVIPLHPRARRAIEEAGLTLKCKVIDPVGYLEMIGLIQHSQLVLTDSGGLQKEAYFFGKPCVTLRDQTEWVELVEAGVNELVGSDSEKILLASRRHYGREIKDTEQLYGGGMAAARIVRRLGG